MVRRNQILGRFKSIDPAAMACVVDVDRKPDASDMALVTEDYNKKHLLIPKQVKKDTSTIVNNKIKVNFHDSKCLEETR